MAVNARHERALQAQVDGQVVRVLVRARRAPSLPTDDCHQVTLDGRVLDVDAQLVSPGFLSLLIDGKSYLAGLERLADGYAVTIGHDSFLVTLAEAAASGSSPAAPSASGPARLKAPMPGKIVRVLVELGASVAAAQGLVVMEAMKMENELKSPRAGRVCELHVREGQTVEAGQPIAVVE
jgi:biotin carboxyl carrier protein